MCEELTRMTSGAPTEFREELEIILCRQHSELREFLDKLFVKAEHCTSDAAHERTLKPTLPSHPKIMPTPPVRGDLVTIAHEAAMGPPPQPLAFKCVAGVAEPSSHVLPETLSLDIDLPSIADPTHAASAEVPGVPEPSSCVLPQKLPMDIDFPSIADSTHAASAEVPEPQNPRQLRHATGNRTHAKLHKTGTRSLILGRSITENRKGRSLLHRVLKSWTYEVVIMVIVIVNAIFIGIDVQEYALLRGAEVPESFKQRQNTMESIFLVIFVADVAFRVAVQRYEFFLSDAWSWNLLDALLVMVMVMEFLAQNIASFGDLLGDVPVLRVLRILRVMRLLRIIKILRSAKELRVMFSSIFSSVKPLCWACVILLMLLYVFGVTFTLGAVDHLQEIRGWDKEESRFLIHHFGSIDASVVSLFEAVTGGISWGELFDLASNISALHTALFMFYIIFTLLGIMNIVTGVFVETAMGYSKQDSETLIQDEMSEKHALLKKLEILFTEIDTNRTGSISIDELEEAFEDERMQAYLSRMGLRITDAQSLFELLDRDQQGQVEHNEFLDGFMKLQGKASSVDVAKLQLESKWILHNIRTLTKLMARLGSRVGG